MPNSSAAGLSPTESRDLRRLAGIMIPADAALGMPGADDPTILADIERTLGQDHAEVRAALGILANLAHGTFADLDPLRAEQVAADLHASGGPAVAALGRAVLASYYRDARVLRALGLPQGPHFPKGRVLEQGDWSLLDAVRNRPKMWRDAP